MSTPDDTFDENTMIGEYANFVSVGSTQTEFYLDFMHVVPGTNDTQDVLPVRRLLISPMLIRGLIQALEQEVQTYESTYNLQLPTVES